MKKLNLLFLTLIAASFLFVSSCGEDDTVVDPVNTATTYEESTFTKDCDGDGTDETYVEITVTDLGEGTGTTTWTKDKIYNLNGFVFVNAGQTLTIEAGTIIKGKSGQGENASALLVARGATINAVGTASEPIIFTSETDDVARDNSGSLTCAAGNLSPTTRGLWGGLVVLGNASLNSTPGETAIEGLPTTELRGLYGGTDDNDSSGTLKYVSIRHGGTDISSNNEINGLTLGGVGAATTVEFIEVFANKDDGVEWFGGTVNTKNVVVAYCGDDAFDYDEGWRGMNQYWFVYQDAAADNGGEHDGGTDPETALPYATPVIYNATFFGSGENRALRFRDNAGGEYHNSIFVNYAEGVEIEKLDSDQDSYKQFLDGNLAFTNNVFWNIPNEAAFIIKNGTAMEQTDAETYFSNNGNTTATDPALVHMVPTGAVGTGTTPTDAFFDQVNYKGAFDPTASDLWLSNWTLLDELGLIE